MGTTEHLSPAAEAAWALYATWCGAKGYDDPTVYLPERLEEFWADVPVKPSTRRIRERGIVRAMDAAGSPVPAPLLLRQSAWRVGGHWADLGTALAAIPTVGWLKGMRGRRDAYLLTLLHQGFTRAEAREITTAEIDWPMRGRVFVRGELIPTAADPARCPACAVCRQVRAISLAEWRSLATLMSTMNAQRSRAVSHVCQEDPWEEDWSTITWTLLPAITQTGDVDVYGPPISRTTISAISAYRLYRPWLRPLHSVTEGTVYTDLDPDVPALAPEVDVVTVRAEVDDLFDQVDEKLSSVDAIFAAIEAELKDS